VRAVHVVVNSLVMMNAHLRSKSAPRKEVSSLVENEDLSTPFVATSAKLNSKQSSTLPLLAKKYRSSTFDDASLKSSVSAQNEKLKQALAKAILQPPSTKENDLVTDLEGQEHSVSSPTKKVSDSDLRQIAVDRANRAVQKQRRLQNAEKEQIALERKIRAEVINYKQKLKDRHRAEVYAVNEILKKLEMDRFDQLREERGTDRSFLEYSSESDNSSGDENEKGDEGGAEQGHHRNHNNPTTHPTNKANDAISGSLFYLADDDGNKNVKQHSEPRGRPHPSSLVFMSGGGPALHPSAAQEGKQHRTNLSETPQVNYFSYGV